MEEPIDIRVTLANLGDALEQHFLDRTEPWDTETGEVVSELDASLSEETFGRVLRLGYHAVWSEHDEQVDHRVYYIKGSDPGTNVFHTPRMSDRRLIPFVRVGHPRGALSLGQRSDFRQLVEQVEADDLHPALVEVQTLLADAAEAVGTSEQVSTAIERTIGAVEHLLPVEGEPVDSLRLIPGGTSITALLRSLVPEMQTRDGVFPLERTGSTNSTVLALAQSLALIGTEDAVVAVDDFGDELDYGAANHLLGLLAQRSSQAWVATRRPDVAEEFEPDEVLRLYVDADGARTAAQFPPQHAIERRSRVTLRHLSPQLLRAATGQCAVIVEGPDDANAIGALSRRMRIAHGEAGLAGCRAMLIHPGLMQATGGHHATSRLAKAAQLLELKTIIVLDGDTDEDDVQGATDVASSVVRLPNGFAIERLLLHGLEPGICERALSDLVEAFDLPVTVDPTDLDSAGIEVLKRKGKGLHATFVGSLPLEHLPPMGMALVSELVRITTHDQEGVVQLETESEE